MDARFAPLLRESKHERQKRTKKTATDTHSDTGIYIVEHEEHIVFTVPLYLTFPVKKKKNSFPAVV